MKLKTTLATASLLIFTHTAVAQDSMPVEEKRGLLGGIVVGAVTGGPIGAGLGALVGSNLVGRVFAFNRENRELRDELVDIKADHQEELLAYQSETQLLNQDLDKLLQVQSNSLRKQETQIQFRTGSSGIETHYFDQLEKVANLLARNPDASVTLAGYSDRRGSESANTQLSMQRARTVKAYLLAHGVKDHQVITTAYGETKPIDNAESFEGNFFDRRVVMELSLDLDTQLATR